jgi:transposase
MKSMTRQQIAHRAGVSVKTLTNWCRPFRKELEALGLRPGMIVLPPVIVKWIADKFCIDLEAP